MEINPAGEHHSSEVTPHPMSHPHHNHHNHRRATTATSAPNGHYPRSDYNDQQQQHQHSSQKHSYQRAYPENNSRIPLPPQIQDSVSRTTTEPSSFQQQQYQKQQGQQQQQQQQYRPHDHAGIAADIPARLYNQERNEGNYVNGAATINHSTHTAGHEEREYDVERDRGQRERERQIHAPGQDDGNDNGNGGDGGIGNGSNSSGHSLPDGGNHTRIHSAPHSFPSSQQHSQQLPQRPPPQQHSLQATVSHHPNALNRYPFSIPSISAKLDKPYHSDGTDALSTLWKKTTPSQEPYFRTRHPIASQHTLSTLGGVLFSLDEVPANFSQDMYIAMRNRIFELEAKAVNYSPFSHSRKRSMDRSGLEDYPDRYGYDTEPVHHSKRPHHGYPTHPSSRHHGPPDSSRPPSSPSHRLSSSYPSWYTPDVYTNGSQYPPRPSRHPVDREMDYRPPGVSYHNPDSRPNSRPGTPPPGTIPDPMCSAYSPPPRESSSRRPSAHHSHAAPPPQQSGPAAHESHPSQHHGEERAPHNGPYLPNGQSHPHHPPSHGPPPHSLQHPPPHPHTQPTSRHQPQGRTQAQQQQSQGYSQQQHHTQQPIHPNGSVSGASSHNPTSSATVEQRQSDHQQRHRAQQQAQSAHSRSYHLHKHMRMLDQQRAAQLAAQQQQQQKQTQQQQGQPLHSIQRQYQSHQRMHPGQNQPIAIKPHPQPPQQHPMRPNPFHPQQRLTQQQQLMQRYQQQRQLQQKQQQLRQLQYLRSRSQAQYSTQKSSHHHTAATTGSSGSHSPTPPRVFGSQVDRPIKKSTRPLECSNCMALDSLSWRPKAELQVVIPEGSSSTSLAGSVPAATGSKLLCPACTQYLQTHGKDRPVPTFRTNFLKKIHTRFKRELQEVRFQGWQDAQVLEIEDHMVEREFQMVFNGLDESDAAQIQSRQSSASAKGSPVPVLASDSAIEKPKASALEVSTSAEVATKNGETKPMSADAKDAERVVVKIEDDDDSSKALAKSSRPENIEVRTFQSEASMGELFGQRWRTEPVVGYTLVHFGGSDRTRMVPMNPTVPSLTVTFNRSTESITFAFRVLVNGLCLLASGGGPPALHMPEMADDDESEEEEEVVVVLDNDKEDSVPPTPSQGTSSNQPDATTTTSDPSVKASKAGDSTVVVASGEDAPTPSDGNAPNDTDADATRDK